MDALRRAPVPTLAACRYAEAPLPLQVADGFAGLPFRDHLTVEVDGRDCRCLIAVVESSRRKTSQ
jgi:hypothetical protein